VWRTPEKTVKALPDVTGLDAIELGCGTAYFGAWLRRSSARRVAGIDVTPAQLDTARRLNEDYYSYVSAKWARKWSAEEIWRARRLPG
jgi:predicted RNA methylase